MKRDLPLAERLDRSPNEFITDIIARPIGKSLSCLLGLWILVLIGWLCWVAASGICHWVEQRPRIAGIAGIKFGCKPPKWEDVGGFDGFNHPETYVTPIGNKVYRIVLRSSKNEIQDYSEAIWIIRKITGIEPEETSDIKRDGTSYLSVFKDPNSSRWIKVKYSSRWLYRDPPIVRLFGSVGSSGSKEYVNEKEALIEAVDEEVCAEANAEEIANKLRRAR